MPFIAAIFALGSILFGANYLMSAAQPHYYTFNGWWPNGVVAHAPWYHDCQENGWNTTADFRCAAGETHSHLAKPICEAQAAYANALPGLGFRGASSCTLEQ